jgi:tetratricopeptide (TPR) repeat protein
MSPAAASSRTGPTGPARWWPGLLLVVAGVAAYANSLATPFLFDDFFSIHRNPTILQLWPLSVPLSPPADGSSVDGRPVVNFSFALNHAVGGLAPLGYHAANLAIHLLAALALYGILRRLLPRDTSGACQLIGDTPAGHPGGARVALVAALLWLLHPLQTESVTFVVQRTESLMGLFFLTTLYAFVRAVENPGSRAWPALAVAACLLGMGTKEVMVTAPLLVFLFDRTFCAGSFAAAWRRRRGLHLTLAATMVVVFGLMWRSGASRGNGTGAAVEVNPWNYLLTQAKALVLYVRLAAWPHPLVVDYGTGVVTSLREALLSGLAVLMALGATAWALVRRPAAGFLGAWFFVILAPSSSVVPLATQTMAEHRMYLPLVSLAVLGALALGRLGARAGLGAGLALAAAYGGLTAWRNHDYRSPVAIWTQTARFRPQNERAHHNLGQALYQEGRFREAATALEVALTLRPSVEVHGLLGLTLWTLGRPQEALAHAREAVRLGPASAAARFALGQVNADLGRLEEARPELLEAVRLAPGLAEARASLGLVAARLGRLPEAQNQLEEALKLEPDNPVAHGNLGSVFFQLGNLDEAARHYEQAVQLNPRYAEGYFNLGMTQAEQGRRADAVRSLQRALDIQPGLQPARELLNSLQASGGTKP